MNLAVLQSFRVDVPALIRRPNLDLSRSEFLEQLALSMATTIPADLAGLDAGRLVVGDAPVLIRMAWLADVWTLTAVITPSDD